MEDMDMDLESEEEEDEPRAAPASRSVPAPRGAGASSSSRAGHRTGDTSGGRNPYPLEGKYIDEDDRDQLEDMPEIEREEILAARLEEMQKYKDSMALDAMFRSAAGGGVADDDDDDEGPSRKKRKHTSVTKKASDAIKDLKSKRKAQDERAARRAARREARPRSTSPTSDTHSAEDGEISHFDRSYNVDSPRKPAKKAEKRSVEDTDAEPVSYVELNSARLSRYEIVDMCFKDGFEDVAKSSFVRIMANEPDADGRPKYRIHRIVDIDESGSHGQYTIEYQGRNISDSRALLCQYGKVKRLFRIADVSNGDIIEGEFRRMRDTWDVDGVKLPKRSELKKKHEAIKELRDRPMTNDEINRQVEARKKSNITAQRNASVTRISQLMASKDLAIRRNDHAAVAELESRIRAEGGDPTNGKLISDPLAGALDDGYEDKIAKINEMNRKRTKEAMAAAHLAGIAKKKAEDAIVKARISQASSLAPDLVTKPVATPPLSGLKKGETPQKYIARTIDLDLGDF
ncbi:hypothetical protein BD324DRAFT_618258 [Kockovaella imperatae]|uniref:Plus3 domain-containing protein n=1 Tax=Kockovaella imperatae TaxID=4999 RepID=A0A1Y1ULU6_9TREE|nr:hypothetical protein BD324DRAFT_618258 [Kockovaella imperatae]ORX39021.1 hypothetical protein BD324DRAFT_618258 [Kockovaella imperatae]